MKGRAPPDVERPARPRYAPPMSEAAVREALALLEERAAAASFEGAKTPWLVDDAEVVLGFRVPPSYREFLVHLGCGRLGDQDFYGVVDDDFADPGPLEVVGVIQRARRDQGLPWEYLPVAPSGDGYLVLDLSRVDGEGEAPVLRWAPGATDLERVVVAASYGAWFLARVRAA